MRQAAGIKIDLDYEVEKDKVKIERRWYRWRSEKQEKLRKNVEQFVKMWEGDNEEEKN